jgi:hypothetical protein
MIFHITHRYEDDQYRDIQLECAVTDYSGPTYQVICVYDKADSSVAWTDWLLTQSNTTDQVEVDDDDVPLWAKCLKETLRAKIEAQARGG